MTKIKKVSGERVNPNLVFDKMIKICLNINDVHCAAYHQSRREGGGGQGVFQSEFVPPPHLVTPIPTSNRGLDYAYHIITCPLPLDFQAFRRLWYGLNCSAMNHFFRIISAKKTRALQI